VPELKLRQPGSAVDGVMADEPTVSGPVFAAVLAILLLMPFTVQLAATNGLLHGYERDVALYPVDLASAALIVVGSRTFLRRLCSSPALWGCRLFALVDLLLLVALAAHPSWRGAHLLVELIAALYVAVFVAEHLRMPSGRVLLVMIGAIAVAETIWSLAQVAAGGPLGLAFIGESSKPLLRIGLYGTPRGSFVHPYSLAGFALVSSALLVAHALRTSRRPLWLVAAAVAVAPVGFTYSRAAALGVAGAAFVLAVGAVASREPSRRRALAAAAVAIAFGFGVPAAVANANWRSRASSTVGTSDAESFTTNRTRLDHEAIDLMGRHLALGVGTGQYVAALIARYHGHEPDPRLPNLYAVHDVPLMVGAEAGVVALGAALALLVGLGWGAWRGGPAAAALYLAFLPFWVLDYFPYGYPQGIVMTGLWVGGVDGLNRTRRRWLSPPS
jgi:hypothetical protein